MSDAGGLVAGAALAEKERIRGRNEFGRKKFWEGYLAKFLCAQNLHNGGVKPSSRRVASRRRNGNCSSDVEVNSDLTRAQTSGGAVCARAIPKALRYQSEKEAIGEESLRSSQRKEGIKGSKS